MRPSFRCATELRSGSFPALLHCVPVGTAGDYSVLPRTDTGYVP